MVIFGNIFASILSDAPKAGQSSSRALIVNPQTDPYVARLICNQFTNHSVSVGEV